MSVSMSGAIALYLVTINVLTFALFRIDKQRAIMGDWRIPEANLLTAAFLGGSLGARAGQVLLRHKTRKEPFRSQLRGIMVMQIVVVAIATGVAFMPTQRSRVLTLLQSMVATQRVPAETARSRPQVIVHRGLN